MKKITFEGNWDEFCKDLKNEIILSPTIYMSNDNDKIIVHCSYKKFDELCKIFKDKVVEE